VVEHVQAVPIEGRPGNATTGVPETVPDHATGPVRVGAPLADLCTRDPLDLDADPRLCPAVAAPQPCGPLCTPWCLASHATTSHRQGLRNPISGWDDR